MKILADTPSSDGCEADALGADMLVAPRNPILRGLVFFLRSRDYDRVLTTITTTARVLAVLLALTRQRKLVLLYFIAGMGTGARSRLSRAVWRFALPRAAVRIQVMTDWEADVYASRFGVDRTRFAYVPWPLVAPPDEFRPPDVIERHGVVASGLQSCDWETFFAAAHGQAWEVTAICAPWDLTRVRALAEDATVLCDIPNDDHFLAVCHAAVYVLPLQENGRSAGHVRLMTAIAAGTPVVASDIRGLAGYLEGTAQPVPPGDPVALRRAIQRLLDDPRAARAAAATARAAVVGQTRDRYIAQLRALLD